MAKPEIRLKGFKGEWERDSFTNTFRFLKNNSLSRADLNYEDGKVRNVHYGDVLIKFGELLDVSHSLLPYITNKEIADRQDKENLLQNGDIVFADAAEDNTVGKCSEIQGLGLTDNVVSGLHTIPCRPIRQFEKGYLGYFLNSNSYHDQLLPMIQGTKVCGISKGNLNLTTITYPNNKEEQVALADYFKSLDSMIQGVTKKIASLKQMKQACLVSMFPQAGETTPRVRFKGFKGEWQEKSFGELYYHNVIKNDMSFNVSKVISVANMYFNPNTYISDPNYLRTYNIFRLGDIAFEGNKSKNFAHGRFVENTIGDGIVSHVFEVFSPINQDYDLNYWKYAINNERIMGKILMRCTKASTMMTNLVANDFLKEKILIPSNDEQKKIGLFFTSLDKQISLQEARLEKLKQIKAACLDKMFV